MGDRGRGVMEVVGTARLQLGLPACHCVPVPSHAWWGWCLVCRVQQCCSIPRLRRGKSSHVTCPACVAAVLQAIKCE